jgi:LysM repeat protein
VPTHKVKPGDCLSSIAAAAGFDYKQIWNHPDNAELKAKRKDPNVLYPGDVVVIPDKAEKTESCGDSARHQFRRKGVPEKLKLRLLDVAGEPRKNLKYELVLDSETLSGSTDGDGLLEAVIPPDAETAVLRIVGAEPEEEYVLSLGELDPADEISGIQARLENLGYECGEIDGIYGPVTATALLAFQHDNKLEESGEVNQATIDKLKELHGS